MRALWEAVRRWWLAVAATLTAVTLPFKGVLGGWRTAMYGDVNEQTVPFFAAVWREIAGPGSAFWNPNIFAGHSTLGTGQFAVLYPFNFLFGVFGPVEGYRWWFLFHLWAAGLTTFAWAWNRWGSRPGAVVAGVGYALSGSIVFHLMHPAFLAAAAWLPLVFLGMDRLIERWSTGRALLVALPIGVIGLLGHPQLLWMSGLGALVYAVGLLAQRRPDWAALGRVFGALGCGAALTAVQMLPLFLFSRDSVRPTLDAAAAFEGSLLPHQFLMLLFPYLFGGSIDGDWATSGLIQEVGGYVGVTILALGVVAVVARRRDRAVRALLITAAVTVVIALGGSSPLGGVLYRALPGAALFRHWPRILWVLNLVLAVLAALGTRELLRNPRRFLPGLVVGVVGSMALAAALPHFAPVAGEIATGSSGGMALARPAVLLLGVVVAAALAMRWRRTGSGALVVVCALDVILFATVGPWRTSATPEVTAAYYDTAAVSIGFPHDAPGGIDRWASDWYGFRSLSVVKDLYGVNGYDPLIQEEWAETAGGFLYHGNPSRPDLWGAGWTADVLRVSTLILQEQIDPSAQGWQREHPIPGLDFVRWTREPRLDEAYLVGAVAVAPLTAVRAALLDPGASLDQMAFVERSPGTGDFAHPGRRGTVTSADVLGSGKVVVSATGDALLVLSHTWAPGWRATVDGRPAPVLRTNGLVLGVPVPAGDHVVRVSFRPPGLIPGAFVSLVSLAALIVAGPVVARTRRRYRDTGVGQPEGERGDSGGRS